MPFTPSQLANAGETAINYYLKNVPIDNIVIRHPFLKRLEAKKKTFPGALQYVIEQLRFTYGANFQWYRGDAEVSYNARQTIMQAQYPWSSAHDGFALTEDQLTQNGIILTDTAEAVASKAEVMQLTNLLKEQNEALREGFYYSLDYQLYQNGSQSADAVAGLDNLISTTPTTGTVGGINAATSTWWQNYAQTGISTATAGNLITQMEIAWRACTRNGGTPDFIMCGSAFLDAYRGDAEGTVTRFLNIAEKGGTEMDASVTGLAFHNIPVVWAPIMDDLEANLSPTVSWSKRCYFINTNYLHWRPAQGHDMIVRKPPRVYNRYVHYWGLTTKGALTTGRRNAHAVLAIA